MNQTSAGRFETVLDMALLLGGWQLIKPMYRWPLYLMASYRYYELDQSLMPNVMLDYLCRTLPAGGLGDD